MIYPNKILRFNQSTIGKMIHILDSLDSEVINIHDLYTSTAKFFEEANEFIYSLDVLYLLDVIDYDIEKGVLLYVKRD